MDDTSLMQLARDYQQRAWCPYSKFRVGAALLDADGGVHGGCNVENASYGLTVCAERVALQTAIAAGVRKFTTMALVCDAQGPVAPCGACRQVLAEFAPDLRILCAGQDGELREWRLSELLPGRFELDQH